MKHSNASVSKDRCMYIQLIIYSDEESVVSYIIKDSFSSLIPFSPTKLNPFGAIREALYQKRGKHRLVYVAPPLRIVSWLENYLKSFGHSFLIFIMRIVILKQSM